MRRIYLYDDTTAELSQATLDQMPEASRERYLRARTMMKTGRVKNFKYYNRTLGIVEMSMLTEYLRIVKRFDDAWLNFNKGFQQLLTNLSNERARQNEHESEPGDQENNNTTSGDATPVVASDAASRGCGHDVRRIHQSV
tara:strand:- start:12 stop:431 length:420 start_codon:yes stop_codon:yes gene_type:complete